MPIPHDGGDDSEGDPQAAFKKDIREAKGRTLLVETTAAGWGKGRARSPQADWQAKRFDADPLVMGATEPVAALIAEELASKLVTPELKLDFASPWTHDLAGRAAAFKAMVERGMDAS